MTSRNWIFSVIHFIIILQPTTISSSSSKDVCRRFSCGRLQIRFPFYLKNRPQHDYCGYPGFELSCTKNKETVVELPLSGAFFVRYINYTSQLMEIYDQNGCIPQRFIAGFNLSHTPFRTQDYYDHAIFNCSRDVEDRYEYNDKRGIVDCLSSPSWKYKVFALDPNSSTASNLPRQCKPLAVSSSWPLGSVYGLGNLNLNSLTMWWDEPKKCVHCEIHGQICGYQNQTSNHAIECFEKSKGEPLGMKIAGQKIPISVSFGIFVIVVSGLIIIFIKIRRRAEKEEKENQLKIEQFLQKNALKPTRYSHAELKRITNKFETKLGQGGYGSVFEGKLSNEGSNNGEEFVNEVATIGRIHHLNVVRLLGFCVEGSTRALIYEFMMNSSLDKFIFSAGKDKTLINLGWTKLQEIAIGIARGMEYLHQGSSKYFARSQIYSEDLDFGLAKLCTKDTFVTVSMAAARGTVGYIAPEVFSRNFGAVSYKSDVYSFGMLLLEMVGGKKNTEIKIETRSDEEYFPEWVYNRLNRGEDLGIQADAEGLDIVKKLTMVALWCIQWNPVDRPSMNGVLHMLEGNTETLHMAPNPFASDDSSFKHFNG
ncbi:hypothetical protein MKX01_037943 [Papaver californicum]|nr:hypothetical protein MKX01_037943 [Papaver californicum]